MPQNPYIVNGKIFTSRGTVPNSVIEINSDLKVFTDSSGNYLADLANLSDGYTNGATYDIVSYDEFNNEYKSDTITITGAGQTKNMYLEPREASQVKCSGFGTPIEIRTLGNKPISVDNSIPVISLDRPFTKKMQNNSAGQPTYIGEAYAGTLTSESKWRIRKMEYDDGATKPPTGETWAKGNTEFDKIWDNRTSYTYG